jgi:hypothetical protein
MNKVRAAVWLSYLMIALTIIAMGASIWGRAQDPMWSQMADSRRNFDILHGGIAAFAMAVAYGLWQRREWSRIFAITLGAIVLFYSIGIKFVLPFMAPSTVQITFDWVSLAVGALSIICMGLLSRLTFRQGLTANSAPHTDARHAAPVSQPSLPRAGEHKR